MKDRPDPGERGRETGEGEHHGQDEPDVVGLPDRRDGIGDDLSLPVFPGAGREEIPHAATEIGAAEQDVGTEREGQYYPEDLREREIRHAGPAAGTYRRLHSVGCGLRMIW